MWRCGTDRGPAKAENAGGQDRGNRPGALLGRAVGGVECREDRGLGHVGHLEIEPPTTRMHCDSPLSRNYPARVRSVRRRTAAHGTVPPSGRRGILTGAAMVPIR